jgi:hypothetical protein
MSVFVNHTPAQLGEVAIGLANSGFRLGQYVTRYTDKDFRAGGGRTAYLAVPGALTARSRALDDVTSSIVLDEITEQSSPVSLASHYYSAVPIGDAELTLEIQDFGRQVLAPQVDSIVDKVEKSIADAIAGVTPTGATYSSAAPSSAFVRGRRELRNRGVDVAVEPLVAFVGGNVVDDLLETESLSYAKTGSADALRKGSLGALHGFELVESGSIGADEIVFTTRSGLYIATRSPIVPEGASFGAIVQKDGLSMRYLRDYDATKLVDRSVVSTFGGAGISPLYDVTRNYETGETTIDAVPGGAVVKFDTAA